MVSTSTSSASAPAVAEEEGAAAAGMEAWRFGFCKFSQFPACKFDPTDADIVAAYLLPRALYGRGHTPSPYPAAAVIEDDAARCQPWSLMREHGHDASAHAFFVHDCPGGGRRDRVVKNGGGVWRLQKSEEATLTILRDGGGGELDVAYKRLNLSFHRAGERASTGWVMHEYEITSPPLPTTVLSRIRATSRVKDKRSDVKEEPAASGESTGGDYNNGYIAGGHQLAVTEPDEPGPIKQCGCADFNIYCNDAGAGDSANHYNAGGSNGSYSYYGGDNNNYGHNNGVPYNSDKPGPSHQYHYGGQVAGNGFLTDGDVR